MKKKKENNKIKIVLYWGLTCRPACGPFSVLSLTVPGRSAGFGDTTLWVWLQTVCRPARRSLPCLTCSAPSDRLGTPSPVFYHRSMATGFRGKADASAANKTRVGIQITRIQNVYNIILFIITGQECRLRKEKHPKRIQQRDND